MMEQVSHNESEGRKVVSISREKSFQAEREDESGKVAEICISRGNG